MAPQELKDQMFLQLQQAQLVALRAASDLLVDSSYDAGAASVPAGGFSQADVDAAKAQGVQEGHDAEKLAAKSAADVAIDAT